MQNSALPFVVAWHSTTPPPTSEVARLLAGGDARAARRILRMRRAVALARADRAFGELVSGA
ncbi:hypothetical protein AB0F72_10320 [Actinoplanes sp. NPDC023936]|uniref:hypothetical protein n=1 Tax=Actinoplanes sp. NPDC023936 TaxID=3154910 RepID=UPI0033C6C6A9